MQQLPAQYLNKVRQLRPNRAQFDPAATVAWTACPHCDRAHQVNPDDTVMDVEQAADFLGMGVKALYQACARGKVPHFRIGRSIRFRLGRLQAWMDAGGTALGGAR